MKCLSILSATVFAGLLTSAAQAAPLPVTTFDMIGAPVQSAGLAWRCGKKNPAEWGTFGNGCLKQKRAARRGA